MNKLVHDKYEEPLDTEDYDESAIIEKLRKTSMQILEKVEANHKRH